MMPAALRRRESSNDKFFLLMDFDFKPRRGTAFRVTSRGVLADHALKSKPRRHFEGLDAVIGKSLRNSYCPIWLDHLFQGSPPGGQRLAPQVFAICIQA